MKYFVIAIMVLALSTSAWAQSNRPIWTVPDLSDQSTITVFESNGSITMGTVDRQNGTWQTFNTDSDRMEMGHVDRDSGNVTVHEYGDDGDDD